MAKKELRAYVRKLMPEEHALEAYVSTAALASDGMIILPRAWEKDMAMFMANPVIPWQHNYDLGPVAQATEWRIDEMGLVLKIQFDMKKPLGIETWNSYEGGFLRAFSVGWETKEQTPKPLTADEVLEQFGGELPTFVKAQVQEFGSAVEASGEKHEAGRFTWRAEGIPVVLRAALLEASCVTVPADRHALVTARATGRLLEQLEGQHAGRPGWEDTNPDDAEDGQIRYRVKDPGLFEKDSFKTEPLDVKAEGDVQLVLGKLTDAPEGEEGSMVTQAVHFDKSAGWTMDEAKTWWEENEKKGKKAADEPDERIGKVLSAKNKSIIQEALKALQAVLAAAEVAVEKDDEPDDVRVDPEEDFAALVMAVEREDVSRKLDDALAGI